MYEFLAWKMKGLGSNLGSLKDTVVGWFFIKLLFETTLSDTQILKFQYHPEIRACDLGVHVRPHIRVLSLNLGCRYYSSSRKVLES